MHSVVEPIIIPTAFPAKMCNPSAATPADAPPLCCCRCATRECSWTCTSRRAPPSPSRCAAYSQHTGLVTLMAITSRPDAAALPSVQASEWTPVISVGITRRSASVILAFLAPGAGVVQWLLLRVRGRRQDRRRQGAPGAEPRHGGRCVTALCPLRLRGDLNAQPSDFHAHYVAAAAAAAQKVQRCAWRLLCIRCSVDFSPGRQLKSINGPCP